MTKRKPQRAEMEHNDECWKYGQHHYECALKKIEQQNLNTQFWKGMYEQVYTPPHPGNH